jgi:hypothetical protein
VSSSVVRRCVLSFKGHPRLRQAERLLERYSNPEFAQDLVFTPERHYTDQGRTERIYSEMHTGDWWCAVQVRNTILDTE